ncbi:endonuclease/exonuclease/phosphatase family protein [Nocardioides sp.]|uniref:endonuclease/exonuclease/phosphatase family protein n=1 Tax=Nocardioides sp. TaxID=35761 RepID=UPI002B63D527|nr:endonuclease/exonuclease/phosphatase family protein [Nocardioides sp.]HXH80484.1 endonuclease/exonuclease/phosphatase family protein [Nocardioides sp.]
MPHTPKAFAAACALTLSLALTPAALGTPTAHADMTSTPVTITADETPGAEKPKPPNGYGLRLTTFNILSSSIARGGVDRATRAARWVQEQGADAAAFQEVAKDQLRQMQTVMPRYNFFPRRGLGTRGSAIQIAWNSKTVKMVETGHIMRPFLGWARPIPYVRLRDRETGRGFWVVAIHNAPGGQEHDRDVSTAAEIKLVEKMLAGRDRPVLVIGDVNERSEFCQKFAAATPLVSMNGGTAKNPCPVPRFGGPDWMLGSGAEFSGFKKVYNGISDHPALTARAWVPSAH